MKLQDIDLHTWKKIANSYSALGEKDVGRRQQVSHFHCRRFRNPIMSPHFIWPRQNFSEQLKAAEVFFAERPARYHFDSVNTYVSLVGVDPRNGKHPLLRVAQAEGWQVGSRLSTFNVWDEAMPFVGVQGFHFALASWGDRCLVRDFNHLMLDNFPVNKRFLKQLNHTLAEIEKRIKLVMVYTEKGRPAACGLVAFANGGGFLFCGAVAKPYRQRGLWGQLVAARQMVSAQQETRFWVTTTESKEILGKGQKAYAQTVLHKNLFL